MRRVGILLLLTLAVAGTWMCRERLVALTSTASGTKELLFLPNGKYLRSVAFGHAPLLADAVYLWAIQYYSDYEVGDRYRFVEHVFGEVIEDLDPHFVDPAWLGAIILTTEAKDLEGGLRLLDQAFASNPGVWILPFLAGWECERVGQFARAADYFDRADKSPGAPASLRRLKAGMIALAGDVTGAIALWRDVLDDPRNDDAARAIASRQIRSLRVRADVETLTRAIATYRERTGRLPSGLEGLVRDGVLVALPLDPDGRPYAFDSITGQVSSVASRVLGP